MKHHLENHLWDRIREGGEPEGRSPREVIAEMLQQGLIQSAKQGHATLVKWCNKNPAWYEYGVCLDLGWKLPEGRAHWKAKA